MTTKIMNNKFHIQKGQADDTPVEKCVNSLMNNKENDYEYRNLITSLLLMMSGIVSQWVSQLSVQMDSQPLGWS